MVLSEATYSPSKHGMLCGEPLMGQAWPVGHAKHALEPIGLYVPAAQAATTLVVLQLLPAGQSTQAVEPCGAYRPSVQGNTISMDV